MKMAGLPEWEIGPGRVRVGSPRNREEAMLAVPLRSTLTPQYSRCPPKLKLTRQSRYESSKNKWQS